MSDELHKTILIVEDEPIIALSEKLSLRKMGYKIIIAASGEEALEIVLSGKLIDLILMDIDLGGGLDGPETAEQILKSISVPIVFLSSHSEREMVERVRGITRYGYVVKSSGDFVLQTSIEMAFELFESNKRLMNELSERKRDESVRAARLHLWEYSISHSLDELIEEAMNEAEKLSGSKIGFYHFVDSEQKSLTLQNWSARTKKEFCKAAGKGTHYDIAQAGVWVDCMCQRKPVIHNDYMSLPHRKGLPEGHAPVIRELVVPVFRGEIITTILGVGNKQSDYTERDAETLFLFADQIEDIVLRKRAEEARNESEKKFRDMTELLPQIVFEMDVEGVLTYVNKKGLEICGYTDPGDNMLGMKASDLFIPEDKERSIENIKRSIQGIQLKCGNEYTMYKKDGSTFQVLIFSDPVYKANMLSGLRGIIVDISERKKAENKISNLLLEKDLILKEVHHRIKNNMATVKSLLDLQAGTLKDPAAVSALRDAESRIKSMMVLYDKLYKSVGFGEMPVKELFSALIDSIIEEFPGAGSVSVIKNIQDIILEVKKIQPLSIIINELITNIMKYAFNGREKGEIYFNVSAEQDRILIKVGDNGNGIPESVNFENSTGFGLMLVGILVQQLEGSICINRDGGSEFLIEFRSRYAGLSGK